MTIKEFKVYFNEQHIAIAHSEQVPSFSGDYFANEYIELSEDVPIIGESFNQLLSLSREAKRLQLKESHISYNIVNMMEHDNDCEDCGDIVAKINDAMEELDDHLQAMGLQQ